MRSFIFASVLVALFAGDALAQGAKGSYAFMGLGWGIAAAEARAKLEQAGFRVVRTSDGAQEEFVVNGLHAVITAINRGKRLVATGRLAGQPVTVELAFGDTDQLHHAGVTSRFWDGTIEGAKALVDMSTRVVMLLEEQYGPARKRKEDGWVDTASWARAKDGSLLAVYVRGVEGFMFSPSYKTALRVDFTAGKLPAAAPVPVDPLPEVEAPQPAKPRLLTKEELRKEYQRDPSAIDVPPPGRK